MRISLPGTKRARSDDVSPLWRLALGPVLDGVATQHQDDFVTSVMCQPQLRDALVDALLRRRHTSSTLADSDTFQLVRSICHRGTRLLETTVNTLPLAEMPYQLRAVVKQMFHVAATRASDEEPATFHGQPTGDNCIEFAISDHIGGDEQVDVFANTFLDILERVADDECVPSVDDVGDPWEDVDITERFGVEPETVLHDAHRLRVNLEQDQLDEEFREAVNTWLTGNIPRYVPQREFDNPVFERKPRVRLVFNWVATD